MSKHVVIDPQILGSTPVFAGTRVPNKTLFDYLEDNYKVEEFLEHFPTVDPKIVYEMLAESSAQ